MATYNELLEQIKRHTLGDKEEAFKLYFSFCNCLKEKYGLVNRDYDRNPQRRGKEWLDIHHIKEYETDDIARKTNTLIEMQRKQASAKPNEFYEICASEEEKERRMKEIEQKNPHASIIQIAVCNCTLESLKPYNVKEQLVYANKIEHFLLHYLIVSIRGKKAGGPNFLWDSSIALEVYGFDSDYLNILKKQKDQFYSELSVIEITMLYKKLIDWLGLDLKGCCNYWENFKTAMGHLSQGVSYVEKPALLLELFDIIGFRLKRQYIDEIISLPFKAKIIYRGDTPVKVINHHVFSMDEKTLITYGATNDYVKSITIPYNVENIAEKAFYWLPCLEKVTIPTSVQKIDDKVFTIGSRNGNKVKTIVYLGTQQMWDEKLSNVILDGIKLQCKK